MPYLPAILHRTRIFIALIFCSVFIVNGLSLTGTVYDYTTGLPVAGATVSVVYRDDIASDMTDVQGIYHLPPLPVHNNHRTASPSPADVEKAGLQIFNLQGRAINPSRQTPRGSNSFSSKSLHNGCYIAIADRTVLRKIVITDASVAGKICFVKGAPVDASQALLKAAADGDTSGRVIAVKNGYLSALQNFVKPTDTLPPIRLLQREQPLGTCGSTVIESAGFVLTGVDTMTVSHPEIIDTISYCDNNDILKTTYASTPAKTTANRISVLTSTRLELDNDPSSALIIDEDNNGVPEAVVLGASSWARPSGSDVQGVWQFAGYTYRAISGALTSRQREALEIEYNLNSAQDLIRRLCMTVAGNSVSFAQDQQGNREVNTDLYFVSTGSVMRDRLDGTALHPDDSTVVIIGYRTSDTIAVVVTVENGRRFHCVNNNPQLADYEYYGNPSSCPNRSLPPWWGDFIIANENDFYRGLGKAASYEQSLYVQGAPVSAVRRVLK